MRRSSRSASEQRVGRPQPCAPWRNRGRQRHWRKASTARSSSAIAFEAVLVGRPTSTGFRSPLSRDDGITSAMRSPEQPAPPTSSAGSSGRTRSSPCSTTTGARTATTSCSPQPSRSELDRRDPASHACTSRAYRRPSVTEAIRRSVPVRAANAATSSAGYALGLLDGLENRSQLETMRLWLADCQGHELTPSSHHGGWTYFLLGVRPKSTTTSSPGRPREVPSIAPPTAQPRFGCRWHNFGPLPLAPNGIQQMLEQAAVRSRRRAGGDDPLAPEGLPRHRHCKPPPRGREAIAALRGDVAAHRGRRSRDDEDRRSACAVFAAADLEGLVGRRGGGRRIPVPHGRASPRRHGLRRCRPHRGSDAPDTTLAFDQRPPSRWAACVGCPPTSSCGAGT